MSNEVILQVKDLVTAFKSEEGIATAVNGVSFDIRKGEVLGLVGESGCGKSVTSLSIMRLLPKPAGSIVSGQILFDGMDLATLPASQLSKIRGRRISMIFQEPMSALNPVHRVGNQVMEVLKIHYPELGDKTIWDRSVELLARVGIPSPEVRMRDYPHQLSGGMRQRIVIAMALACKPEILIADEPTTALDVTVQAQILDLIYELQEEYGMATLFITHDLGVIAEVCDRVVVMYGGMAVEDGDVFDLFEQPSHPYTQGLLASIPKMTTEPKSKLSTIDGMVPSIMNMPKGCRFQNRCEFADSQCEQKVPPLNEIRIGRAKHSARCFHLDKSIQKLRSTQQAGDPS